ncbi:ubiquinol-cytochrome C chaperone family protein [Sandarakinorhabdus sp.]|uniref:ubiquinol-cytochrome C chaperone family protein n=1 Tax=Sandarakinorhabdus sp. TaxID=1916663 RepID=UPI00333E88B5
MSLLDSLKRLVGAAPPSPTEQLYAAVVAQARRPAWYIDGGVPDTMDGRFDVLVLALALLMLRLEDETGDNPRHPAAQLSANLADRFITDMEGNLRQDGIGDQAVPKHMGRMMAALGGRIGAYRSGRRDRAAMADALQRNLYRGSDVPPGAVQWVISEAHSLTAQLDACDFAQLGAGILKLHD